MPIRVHGHRGARAKRPENTIAAFEYAIAAGVDAIELDVAVTGDNVPVISHDPVLHAPLCTGPRPAGVIHELILAEVKRWNCGGAPIPTLDEVFELAPRGSFVFNIEIKSFSEHPELTPPPEDFAALVLAAIHRHGLELRAIVQSFDFRTLHAMKRLARKIRLSALYAGQARSFVDIASDAGGVPIVAPQYKLVTMEQVQAAHRAGIEIVAWTANEPRDWERLVTAGVDGIITDDPAALIAWLRR